MAMHDEKTCGGMPSCIVCRASARLESANGQGEVPSDLLQALHMLNEASGGGLGDFVYQIREDEQEGWEGRRVGLWSDATVIINSYLKHNPPPEPIP